MSQPSISIITPSFQQAPFLEECFASVRGQGEGIEHIVVDGGSTDGSRDIIERHGGRFAWWCCERDSGQSDAINKGLAHASGKVFTWVNSDDAMLPGAATHVRRAFHADPELLVFGGQVIHRSAEGEQVFDQLNSTDELQLFADPIINQPATYYRVDVVRAIGGVDPSLRYVMDVELWWQVLFAHGTRHLRFEPVPLAMFRLHDHSKTVTQHQGFLQEMAGLLHRLCDHTANDDLARVIAIGYPERRATRGWTVDRTRHAELVRTMGVHFLLKWHGHVHSEAEFRMMRALHDADIPGKGCRFLPGMEARWHSAQERVRGTSWNAYRFRRKIKHLFG